MTESIAGNIITETRDGDGRQWIFLSRAPVEEVLSITIDGLDIPPCAGAVDAGYFVVDQSPGRLARLRLRGYVFTRRLGNVIIRYRVAQVPGADSCAAKAERDFDKHPLSLDDLVNAQTAYIERVKASVETESARKLASEALSFGHYSKPLVEAFAAADAYLETPPFQPGHLVVRRDAPQDGYLIVVGCARCGNGWRVESKMRNGIGGEIGDATNYILIPVGWRDPPLAPMSHLARLELSTDGPLWAEDIAEARAADAERGAESAAGMREMAAWHLECGILVNPELAKDQARRALALADEIDPREG